MKKEISSRQFVIMIAISMLTFKLTYLPSILYSQAGKDGLWSFLILILADLASLALILPVFIKHQDVSFSQFLEQRIGKIASKIVYLIFFLFFLMKIIYLTNVGYFFAREAIFQEASLILFLSILFITINALFLFKINSFARTGEFFYPFIVVMLFFCILFGAITAPDYGFLPLFERGAGDIFSASWKTSFCFGDYLFILLFMGKVKIDKTFSKRLAGYMILTIILLATFVYVYVTTFRYTGFIHQPAITDICEFIPLSAVVENLDLMPTTLMLTLYLFHGGLFMFCMVNSLKDIFKFKHKRFDSRWILLLVNIITIPLILYVFESYDTLIYIAKTYFTWITVLCAYLITLFCLLISFKKVKNDKKKLQYAIKIINGDLKWVSLTKDFVDRFVFTKKIKLGGQTS